MACYHMFRLPRRYKRARSRCYLTTGECSERFLSSTVCFDRHLCDRSLPDRRLAKFLLLRSLSLTTSLSSFDIVPETTLRSLFSMALVQPVRQSASKEQFLHALSLPSGTNPNPVFTAMWVSRARSAFRFTLFWGQSLTNETHATGRGHRALGLQLRNVEQIHTQGSLCQQPQGSATL